MAGVQVVTRKLISFQGRDEEYTNVYYFGNQGGVGGTSDADAETILDACINRERPIFSSDVTFLGGSVRQLGPLGGVVEGEALYSKELSPTLLGTFGPSMSTMYRELAVQVRFLLGGRRFLRSMLHTLVSHNYAPTGHIITLPASLSAPLRAWADQQLVELPNGYARCSPNGTRPFAVGYAPYLEHRQFHQGRKRKGLLGS